MIDYHQPDLSTNKLKDSACIMLVIGQCNTRTVQGAHTVVLHFIKLTVVFYEHV